MLRADLVAGVALAAIAIPQSMAYAQTAGLPVVSGLYGLLLPLAVYALLGSSRNLMTGPTATTALMVGPALVAISSDPADYPVLAAMMALLVAAAFVLARVFRLGWVADYFSTSVLLGFLTGLALTLLAGQLDEFTGVAVEGDTPLQEYASFLTGFVGQVDQLELLVGGLSLAALMVGARWLPRFPALLAVTVIAIALSWAWDFDGLGVTLVGDIPAGLPALDWPGVGAVQVLQLVPIAIAVALVGFADAILAARSFALDGGRPVDANQELMALAGVNLAAGLSQSFPLGSSGSRTAINVRVGGRTQVVGLVQVAVAAVVLLFLTGVLALLPKATLAAVIIFAALGLIDLQAWRALWRGSRPEFAIAGVLVLGMITIGLLPSLILAVLLSIIDVVRTSAQPRDAVLGWDPVARRFVDVQRRPKARVVPGVVVYRLDDRLFFANSRYFAGRVREAVDGAPHEVRAVVLDAEAVVSLDASGAEGLRKMIEQLRDKGIQFVIARSRRAFDQHLEALGLTDLLPDTSRFPTVRAAVLAMSGVDVEAIPAD
ncbi:SulP family inorganic anion transporter [Longivirga aurantiaca]|uniref:SulP family inorganic anion transporter n=1 Tax=Longivirga aurantiaca TaxID=1837743 RepID=A0ABW1T4T9_9ACTN